jgi:hypothetical protein
MSEAIRVSHSDIASFLRCRRQFAWSYIDDFREPERLWGPMATGSRVHSAIEQARKTATPIVETHKALAARDEEVLIATRAPGWALDDFYENVIMGRNCCIAYERWVETEGPYDGYDVESEVLLEAPILDGRAILIGKADLLLTRRDDGWIFTDDIKTSSTHVRTTLPVILEKSYQHICYQGLAQRMNPEAHIGEAWYTILFKAKNPARMTHPMVERFRVPGHISALPNRMRQVETIVADMLALMERRESEGAHVAYPTPGDSCRWCPMRLPCGLVDENPLGARALLDVEFVRGGRHARYDNEGNRR